MFPKLTSTKYTYMSYGCYNLRVDEKSPYLTTFSCQFGRHKYKQLLCGPAQTSDTFQRNMMRYSRSYWICSTWLVLFEVGYDSNGIDHDDALWTVLQICRKNLKLNKDNTVSGVQGFHSLMRYIKARHEIRS